MVVIQPEFHKNIFSFNLRDLLFFYFFFLIKVSLNKVNHISCRLESRS